MTKPEKEKSLELHLPPQYNQPYPYVEEDEINLLDLLLVLVKHRSLIIGMVFFAAVAAVTISLLLPNIYRSEATIGLRPEDNGVSLPLSGALGGLGGLGGMVASQFGLGGGGSLEKLEVVLNSRELALRVINKYELLPILFPDDWDPEKKVWTSDEPIVLLDGLELVLENLLKVKSDIKKSTITIGFEDKDPETSKKIVEYFLVELSEILREEVLRDAVENQRFFQKQLEKTSDTLMRDKIYALLAKEIEKETFAQAQKYYSFLVLDPPIVYDADRKAKPKRAIICILSVFVAFFMAVFMAFFIESKNKTRAEDPERYREIVNGLKIWRRSARTGTEPTGTDQ